MVMCCEGGGAKLQYLLAQHNYIHGCCWTYKTTSMQTEASHMHMVNHLIREASTRFKQVAVTIMYNVVILIC